MALAALLAPAVGAERAPMTFALRSLQGQDCLAECPKVLVADGVIDGETPQAFRAFVEREGLAGHGRELLFLDSPGGNVAASMELGQEFRRLRLRVLVAGYRASGDVAGPVAGECESACVYALMGASTRVAPPMSRVALHRMALSPDPGEAAGPGRFADQRFIAILARYAARMGVSARIVQMAESLAPGEVRLLSPRELESTGLASSNF